MSPDPHRHSVTAIVVAHDGSRWLPDTLHGLRSQTRQPDRFVAVDNDSRDRSSSLLAAEFGPDRMLSLPRDTGFGAAVAQALQHPSAGSTTSALEVAGTGGAEWIWLLHDDCVLAPDTLERLLAAADENRYAAVLGPKLLDWLDRRVLLEAGVTIDGAGRRETGLERREFDQGQHDGVHEVLAVNTAGMLVRRDVWDALGGLAPELPLFRDDVDFGWRVNASGHRVLAVATAVGYHAEAATRRRRRLTAVSEHPRRLDRRNALLVLFANLPAKLAAWAVVRNLFGGVLRALVFLLAKQPGHAWDELRAYGSVLGSPLRLLRVRRRRRRGPRRSHHTLRRLLPPRWQGLRRYADMVGEFFGSSGPVEGGRHHAAAAHPEDEEEEEALVPRGGLLERMLRSPAVLLFLVLTAVALVAERSLLGHGRLGGGALLPVAGGAGDLWGQYLSGWHATGLGSNDPASPYVALLALLATLLLGQTWLAVDILLLGCVPLAGAAAYAASGRVVTDARIRVWAGASYALLPVATGAVAGGRLGTAVAFILLPLLGLQAARMFQLGRRKATRAAWGFGGLLAIGTAFVPMLWALTAVLAVLAHRLQPRQHLGRRLLIAVVTPLVLLIPWTPQLFLHPGLFLREAGLSAPETLSAPGPASLLMLQPGGPGMPPVWVAAGVVVLGGAALIRRDRRVVVVGGWLVAVSGMAAAIVVSRLEARPPSDAVPAPGWPGLCLALAGLGIVLAGAVGAERVLAKLREGVPALAVTMEAESGPRRGRARRRGFLRSWRSNPPRALNWRPWAAVGLTGLACFTPVVAAGMWIYTGIDGPLDRHNPPVLPAFVAAQAAGAAQPRALVLRGGGADEVSYTVLRGGAPLLGSAEIPSPPGLTDRVASVVAGLASGRHAGEVAELAGYGIGYVVMPGPMDEELVRTLDSNPKLTSVSRLPRLAIWKLEAPAARLRLLPDQQERQGQQEQKGPQTEHGGVHTLASGPIGATIQVPAGSGPRTLMLAESVDTGWHAELDGRELPRTVVNGWAQGFTVSASGGELVLSYSSARGLWVLLQAALAFVVFILALPGGGAQQEDEEQPTVSRRERRQRRSARTGPRRARGHRAQKDGSSRAGRKGQLETPETQETGETGERGELGEIGREQQEPRTRPTPEPAPGPRTESSTSRVRPTDDMNQPPSQPERQQRHQQRHQQGHRQKRRGRNA